MSIYIFFSFLNGMVAMLFGLFIFAKNKKNITNITFFCMSTAIAVWNIAYSIWLSVPDAIHALFWSRMLNLGATFIPIFYLHWILTILNIDKNKKILLFFGYFATFILALFSYSPYYITSVKQVLYFPYWPQAGPLYLIYLIFIYFGLSSYALRKLFEARKKENNEKLHQINYVILGSIIGFGGGAFNFPLMFGIGFLPPIGQLFVVLYVIIFGLATLRYHLFEIKLILTEMLVGLMGIILTTLPFLMPTTELKILTSIILFLFLFFGYYLVRATREEIARKEEAERISHLKSEFISIVSHQLRTPLSAIRGYTSMLHDGDYGKLTTKASGAISHIHESSVSMIKLINSLLSISRLEKGQVELKIEEISIERIVEECVKDIELLAQEKGLAVKYNKSKITLPYILGDAEKLKQSISNIINNAILYTPQGGVTIISKLKDNNIIIQIKDTGVGIEKEDIEKMFRSFSRGKGGQELYTQGTGLGLYVAKNFIEMHNGRIWVESEGKDKGSCFTIELPVKNKIETKHNFKFSETISVIN